MLSIFVHTYYLLLYCVLQFVLLFFQKILPLNYFFSNGWNIHVLVVEVDLCSCSFGSLEVIFIVSS